MKSKGKYRFISKGSSQKSAERSGAQGPSVVIYLIRSHINRRVRFGQVFSSDSRPAAPLIFNQDYQIIAVL